MKYVSLTETLLIHNIIIEKYGGLQGLRDLGLIRSALARPKAAFDKKQVYPGLFLKAAILTHSLIKNHGFLDGNKRTAMTICGLFLRRNHYKLGATEEEVVEAALAIAVDQWKIENITQWLRANSRRINQ